MMIKLIGLGAKGYSMDRFNLFDCTIVVVSTIEEVIGFLNLDDSFSSGGAISAFRGIRLLRVFKLARSWQSFQIMLIKIGKSLKEILNFSVLLFLFMFTYTLLGMELFALQVKINEKDNLIDEINGVSPRASFDYFLKALTTIFIILIGEDWNNVMYIYVRAKGYYTLIFFISLVIMGNWILLNLFLAILLKNFEEKEEIEENEEPENKISIFFQMKSSLSLKISRCRRCCKKEEDIDIEDHQSTQSPVQQDSPQEFKLKDPPLRKRTFIRDSTSKLHDDINFRDRNNSVSLDGRNNSLLDQRPMEIISQFKRARSLSEPEIKNAMEGNSLFILGPENIIRKFSYFIMSYKHFDSFILSMILVSTVLLTLENPLDDPKGQKIDILLKIDIGVTIIFVIELVVKVLVLGFMFNGSKSYMRTGWNIMDFLIVLFSLISLFANNSDLKVIKVLRMLRVLRPLRMISRNEGLKIAVTCLMNSIPGIFNVLVISLLFFLIFGILGVTYFKGQYYSCLDSDFIDLSLVANKFDCMNNGGVWMNKDANFDSSINAIMSLFIMSTTEGWIGIMWDGVDAAGLGQQPIRNYAEGWVFFYIAFIIGGSLFLLNLFVGVVINTFDQEKERLGKNHLLTERQREWLQINLLCYKMKPIKKTKMTQNRFRNFMIKLSEHWMFEMVIMGLILINTIILALKQYEEPEILPKILEQINYVFAAVFTLEATIKLIAFGWDYFTDGWNLFDFTIVVGTLLSILLSALTSINVGSQATIVRSFRIGRIFRLVKKAKSLKMIFNTFMITIPSLANVGGLLILLLYLFSVLGVFLFATVKQQVTLNHWANFSNFGTAFLTLFRMSTGEAWNEIMFDASRQQNIIFECDENPTYESIVIHNGGIPNGCGSSVAIMYFISFMLIVTMIFLNLFIAIILEGFGTTNEAESLTIQESTVDQFREIWNDFDQTGTGFILISDFNSFIKRLVDDKCLLIMYPLQRQTPRQRDNLIAQLKIPIYCQYSKYHFHDVLKCFSRYVMNIQFIRDKFKLIKENMYLESYGENEKEMENNDDFDSVVANMIETSASEKIAMCDKLKQLDSKFYKTMKKKNHLSELDGKIFDSAHAIMVPKIQNIVKRFLIIQRLKRKQNAKEEDTAATKRYEFSRSVYGSGPVEDLKKNIQFEQTIKQLESSFQDLRQEDPGFDVIKDLETILKKKKVNKQATVEYGLVKRPDTSQIRSRILLENIVPENIQRIGTPKILQNSKINRNLSEEPSLPVFTEFNPKMKSMKQQQSNSEEGKKYNISLMESNSISQQANFKIK